MSFGVISIRTYVFDQKSFLSKVVRSYVGTPKKLIKKYTPKKNVKENCFSSNQTVRMIEKPEKGVTKS